MSKETELRDRLSQIIDRGLCGWDSDTNTSMTDTEHAAQAVIDEFGLTVEERIDEPGKRGINPVQRVIGKWEKQ